MSEIRHTMPQVKEYRLEALTHIVHQRLSPAIAANTSIEKYLDPITQDMVFQLRARVYGQKREMTVRFPASWWDAVKDRWLPRGLSLVNRYGRTDLTLIKPAVYRDIRAELWETFPDLKIRGNDRVAYHFLAYDSVTDEPYPTQTRR